MEARVLELAQGQGLWALLFVTLLFIVLKTNSEREKKYQEIIDKLSNIINEDLKRIKDIITGG